MEIKEVLDFLDWIVSMDFQHYSTEPSNGYIPNGPSHFYLKRSSERFTSHELLNIYNNQSGTILNKRWLEAVKQTKR